MTIYIVWISFDIFFSRQFDLNCNDIVGSISVVLILGCFIVHVNDNVYLFISVVLNSI